MDKRIFVVEDHPEMQQAYSLLLDFEPGLELIGLAGSGEDALQMLEQTPCDLVIADLSLPGMGGIAFVSTLRARQPLLPILVVSGHDETMFAQQAVSAGAQAYLNKLELTERLSDTIRSVFVGDATMRLPTA